MYKGKKILGFIPARGGSKGLPGKNIRRLCGKPLIGWTIDQANNSKYFDRVIVSTDDTLIAKVAKTHGGDVPFLRPDQFARDTSPTLDAVVHALDFLKDRGEQFDYIAILEPTSPLRSSKDLDAAIKQLIDNKKKADSLVSLGEVHMEHPEIIKKVNNGYLAPYTATTKEVFRRQDRDKAFFPYGVIYLIKIKTLLSMGTFYPKRTIPYYIQRWQCYEIDDCYDFLCIEAILKQIIKGEGL